MIHGCDCVNVKKILDSNILIYSLLEGHPASEPCERLIRSSENKFTWLTSPVTFYETFHVLVRIYGQEPSQVLKKIQEAIELPIEIKPLDIQITSMSLEKSIEHSIEINDSILLVIGIIWGIPIIATDDTRLIKACEQYGIICENPITEPIRETMREWERKNLPEKGLGRIYLKVYEWINKKNGELAEEFKQDTGDFKRSL
jgi:predicted nucleic acid-binding protein